MKLKLLFISICAVTFCIFSVNDTFAQQYYKVVKGNDKPATVEQVFDDVKTMDDILTTYKVSDSKATATKENYEFWVAMVKDNNMSIKRKKIIHSFLGEMKSKLKS